MESNKRNGEKNLKNLGGEVDEAIRRATREALKKHKLARNPIAVWRDGKVIMLQPDEIVFNVE